MGLLIMGVAWKAAETAMAKSAALILTLTCIPLFQASVALYPDIAASGFMGLSTLILYRRKTYVSARLGWLYPVAAVVFLFFGFLAKASAYWAIVLWIVVMIGDGKQGPSLLWRRFYWPCFVSGVVVLIIYLVACHYLWGSALSRLEGIQALTGEHLWTLEKAPLAKWIERLTKGPLFMIASKFGALFFMMLIGLWVVPKRVRFWGIYSMVCVLFFWFGSASLRAYEPMPLEWRMLLPALPGMIIVSAHLWDSVSVATSKPMLKQRLVILLLLVFTAVPFALYMSRWIPSDYPQKEVTNLLKAKTKAAPHQKFLLITSEERSASTLSFYFGFRYPDNLTAVAAKDLADLPEAQYDHGFIYMDTHMSGKLKYMYGTPNHDRQIESLGLRPVFQTPWHRLYDVGDPAEVIKQLAP
jgi:hypothetical protein